MLTFENVLTVFRDYLRQDPEEEVLRRTHGRREATAADEEAVDELCQPYLDWRKEAQK